VRTCPKSHFAPYPLFACAHRDARAGLTNTFAPYVAASAGDAAAFARPEVEAEFLESLLETSSRRQEGTDVAESVRVAAHWGFELACVKVPVCVWAGQQDAGTTIHMARHLAARALPHCELRELPGRGHLAFMDDDVMWEMGQWLGLGPNT
jgi:pimeloyl-ACP methyl ester carboxylesterase